MSKVISAITSNTFPGPKRKVDGSSALFILKLDSDPSIGGCEAPDASLGLVSESGVCSLFLKTGDGDFDWEPVSVGEISEANYSTSIYWNPGLPSDESAARFQTWPEVMEALSSLPEGLGYNIFTSGSENVFSITDSSGEPGGVWNLRNANFISLTTFEAFIFINNGARLINPGNITNVSLYINTDAAQVIFEITEDTSITFRNSTILSGSTAGAILFDVSAQTFTMIAYSSGFTNSFDGTPLGTAPFISVARGSQLAIQAYQDSFVDEDVAMVTPGGFGAPAFVTGLIDASSRVDTQINSIGSLFTAALFKDSSEKIRFNPSTPSAWSPAPVNVSDALDQLALGGDGGNTYIELLSVEAEQDSVKGVFWFAPADIRITEVRLSTTLSGISGGTNLASVSGLGPPAQNITGIFNFLNSIAPDVLGPELTLEAPSNLLISENEAIRAVFQVSDTAIFDPGTRLIVAIKYVYQ